MYQPFVYELESLRVDQNQQHHLVRDIMERGFCVMKTSSPLVDLMLDSHPLAQRTRFLVELLLGELCGGEKIAQL